MAAQDIERMGEEIVVSLLRSLGYFRVVNDADIEADSGMRRILVDVIVAQYPKKPKFPSEDVISHLKLLADEKGREPWAALLQINDKGHLVGNVIWTDLRKLMA